MRQYELPEDTKRLILDFSKRFNIPCESSNSKGYGIPSYTRDAMKRFIRHYLIRSSDEITDEQINHVVSLGITQSLQQQITKRTRHSEAIVDHKHSIISEFQRSIIDSLLE